MTKVAPSILSADYLNLGRDILGLERNGADYIVMGRPIYKAPDVRAAVAEIAKSIEEGLSCRK